MINKMINCPYCGSDDVYLSKTGDSMNNDILRSSSGPIVFKPSSKPVLKPVWIGVIPLKDRYYCGHCKIYFGE